MDDPQTRLDTWLAILQVQSERMRTFEAWLRTEHGITAAQFEVLRHLADSCDHGLRMQQLSDVILYSSGATSNVVRRLEEHGLVERGPVPHDARGVHVRLTDVGAATLHAARVGHHVQVAESMPPFVDDDERRAVLGYLTRACTTRPPHPVTFRPPAPRRA